MNAFFARLNGSVARTGPAQLAASPAQQAAVPRSAPTLVQPNDAPEPACFSLAALLHDLLAHGELDHRTLAYHLQQSDATAADGYCHAAINEARSFLEALVVNIVQSAHRSVAGNTDAVQRDHSQNGTAFRTYRRYLHEAGVIDLDENELLQYVYSVASVKGSHHGVTDQAWTRLVRRFVFATGQYLLQRYATWKKNGRPGPTGVDHKRDSCWGTLLRQNGARHGWLMRLARRLGVGPAG